MNCSLRLSLSIAAFLFGFVATRAMEIVGEAKARWYSATPADPGHTTSNAVKFYVIAEIAFTLLDETSLLLTAGAPTTMPHRAGNNGTNSIDLTFEAWNQAGNAYDLQNIQLYLDINRNGRIDPGEPEIPRGASRAFTPGEQINLLARALVPSDAEKDATAHLVIRATEATTGATIHRINSVRVRPAGVGLLVEKTVSQSEATIGDTVAYTIRIRNVTTAKLSDVALIDALPAGFVCEWASLRIDGSAAPLPTKRLGALELPLPTLPAGGIVTVTYRARIGPAALRGDGINRAHASASGADSNTATARVIVREGAFTSNGVILGRAFSDTNGNGQPDSGEPGFPGVRLYLEDGTYVLTDADGKYSFYGVSPRTHVLKLDRSSLPAGAEPMLATFDQAGDAGSRFIILKRSELHRADFAFTLTPEALQEIDARRDRMANRSEMEHKLSAQLTLDSGLRAPADSKALPASGLITPIHENTSIVPPAPALPSIRPAPKAPITPAAASQDAWLSAITDSQLGFVGLADGAVLPAAQTELIVKGPLGAQFTLAVNGAIIGPERVGTKATLPDRNAEAWKFIGLDLEPGENRLRVNLLDAFGNARGSETITVFAPGALAGLKLSLTETVADGTTPARVTIELRDARGIAVTARTPVTLQSTLGVWQTDDLDPATPGVQVFIEGGRQVFLLTSPLEPGECEIRADSGTVHGETKFSFSPNLRPLIASGVIEGALHFGSRARGALLPTGSRDAFEEELRGLSLSSSDGRLGAGARAALLLKGKVRGDFLLTAAYDSDKASDTRLFRDIQPGEYYPVYGDASVRGYDAQSTGRLYVRIDHNRSYALLGDFTTAPALGPQPGDLRTLGTYQRSLNGAKEHYENSRVRANVWASQDSTRQIVAELPANGTSGPYRFDFHDILAQSERVELITRDRDQPSQIISVRSMERFYDYELEPFTGRLLFTAPVASVDRDLNPVAIRVTAEAIQDGAKFWTYGADGQVKLGSRMEVGAAYARDENPDNTYELASAGATFQVAATTTATAEIAGSSSETEGDGLAGRIELRHRTIPTDAHFYLGRTDSNFHNPGSLLLPGRLEGGYKLVHRLTASTSLLSNGLVTEDIATGGRRLGARADVERAFGAYRLAFGVRHSEETDIPANIATAGVTPNSVNSVRVKFTAPLPRLSGGAGHLEYERDIHHADRQMAAAGFDYTFVSGGRAYARHEFISALGGPFELNDGQRNRTTLVGLERSYMKDGQVFNEYRAGNELSGREAEAALGLRNLWRIGDGVSANTSFERITPVAGDRRNEATAVTGMFSLTHDPRWRATTRLELRRSTASDSLLNTLGYTRQWNSDWTFLGKTIVLLTDLKGPETGHTAQGRAQAGFAWRPHENLRWNALGKYELKHESDSRASALFSRRVAHILTADVHYQPDSRWSASIHHAGKWVNESSFAGKSNYSAHLVATRVARRIGKRWETGLNLAALADGDFRQCRYAAGPELGLLLGKNLLVAAGYNIAGFSDRDIASDRTTAQGVFLRLRFKFDETLLAGVDRVP